jgi:triose/dihydroxyacetone kinase / FAD-AMP lyase (cyclizing)
VSLALDQNKTKQYPATKEKEGHLMKHFINEKHTIVTDAIDGFLVGQPQLARLDGYPSIKAVVRADWDKSKVALISGGGSGHEPAHAGFVGKGMLTAAVCGEIFASPSVDAVLAAILAVTGSAGCVLLVKNYTGDRLNFGLAAEKAKAKGLKVEVVICADDIALPEAPQPRGVAGTLFVHKIAGYAAEAGKPLEAVQRIAQETAEAIVSLGVSLSSCTIPGRPSEERLLSNQAELGLGIHGEPGIEKISLQPVSELIPLMVNRLLRHLPTSKTKLALLLNNLGGVPPIEMNIIAQSLLSGMLGEQISLMIGPAPLMTSLDMKGFSLSLLPLDEERSKALLATVAPGAWPAAQPIGQVRVLALPSGVTSTAYPASTNAWRHAAIERICTALIQSEAALNALDAKIGDGDTGSTFATAANHMIASLEALPLANDSQLCHALSERLSTSMGGSSGVLLSIFLASMGTALGEAKTWPEALYHGIQQIQHYGGAAEGDRTMLDALFPAARALLAGKELAAAAAAAHAGAEHTKSIIKARAGRSSYLRADDLVDVADPGAVAVAAMFKALCS